MEEEPSNKMLMKMKKDPVMTVGLAGLSMIVIYGLYNFRKRNISASLYLIHLRLAGQGTLMGCLTLGLGYSLYNNDRLMKILGIKTHKSSSSDNSSNNNDASE